ncbi:MAG TPA: trigger factor family protein, partial [bacterium]|nr:trigger factor family protein [bacterium]
MKIEVKEISELGREINFEIEEEIVNREKERIIKELKKNVEIEGFRKGKVPERIIELRFSSLIKENLLKRIIPDAYLKAIKENNLHPAVDPEIREVKFDDGKLFLKIYTE